MNHVQKATEQIANTLDLLREAKKHLLHARNDQHVSLAMQIAALEEIHGILTDPECTPDISELDGPDDFDDCRWDANRIEATKSILFHEFIERR